MKADVSLYHEECNKYLEIRALVSVLNGVPYNKLKL